MSETPPTPPPPTVTPPPQYSTYPRGVSAGYGSADMLQALCDGYFGLNAAFGWYILLAILGVVAVVLTHDTNVILFGIVGLFFAVIFLTYPHNKKIGMAKGWSVSTAILASVLTACGLVVCWGLLGFVILQQIALSEMKKYGVTSGFMGLKKKNVLAAIESLRAMEPAHVPAPPQF